MCGIVGFFSEGIEANQTIFDGLTMLQHRGQDSVGIMTYKDGQFFKRKAVGLVRDCIHTRHMMRLRGTIGLGHVRYSTAGSDYSKEEIQPIFINYANGIAFVHNGNLTNTAELKIRLAKLGIHINTQSDSEVLANIFASEIRSSLQGENPVYIIEQLTQTLQRMSKVVVGSYSCIAMIAGVGMVAFRDPHGIKPLEVAVSPDLRSAMFASESVAFDIAGFAHISHIEPGSGIFIPFNQKGGLLKLARFDYIDVKPVFAPCIFEYVYLSRPDSVINGVSVSEARQNMGKILAKTIMTSPSVYEIDVVVPVPETSMIAAAKISEAFVQTFDYGYFCQALIKNRYIPRTFIMPGQKVREESIRLKLNVCKDEVKDKNVLVVDDSIVRGTTSRQIVQILRGAGAKKIIFASLSPPVMYRNVYGVALPNKKDLIAANRTIDEVKQYIGADEIIYQKLEDLIIAVNDAAKVPFDQFEMSIFNGEYITGITDKDLDLLEYG